ncbi:DUF2513 domain-containing protein [Pseudoalteromonas sp. SR41-1]|uniref:DUF2513 domain-containing protein n=1 Tax=Pseudoalteromonas sp. SR41-1 TaxID=2760952 RepID=UPI0015FECED0|nr:DUF2513 domain-containing protein [Pseudoalteromonas sp. SR41-1]MBB1282665.1 DUF2513 domain-containing protein [Pseudoalteromonas sp. SR41-1]
MKIDLEYIKDILTVFNEAETAHITFADLKKAGIPHDENGDINQKFLFHYQILIDNELVSLSSLEIGNLKHMGVYQSLDGQWGVALKDLRLTQMDHDFAKSLTNKEVFSKLKSEFKDFSFKVIFDSGRKLLEHVAKKKMDKLLES